MRVSMLTKDSFGTLRSLREERRTAAPGLRSAEASSRISSGDNPMNGQPERAPGCA
jgi:hypothetical protein